jgi:molybdate-binding protein
MLNLGGISEREQLAAIADPTRLAILRRLMAGPATLTQLAAALDSYPAHVRHHVKRLEGAGLIRLCSTVTTRNYTEKFYEATAAAYTVHLIIVPERGGEQPVVILGSHDIALEMLTRQAEDAAHPLYAPVAIGSLDGLVALRQGLADIAGCHLLDVEAGEYNLPFIRHLFPDRDMEVVTLVHREQGLIVAPGNPLKVTDLEDLARPGVRIVNRNPGSGTRSWLDSKLRDLGISHDALTGYDVEVPTHRGVAKAVAGGTADAGLGIRAAAIEAELDFIPLFNERYDLVMDARRVSEPHVQRLLDTLCTKSFRLEVDRYGGYDTSHTGDEALLAV